MFSARLGAVRYHCQRPGPNRRKFLRLGAEKWLLKGVSYGPFDGTDSLPAPDRVLADLRQIAALGFNTVRLHVPPPEWFLKACAAQNLRVLIGLRWPAHTDFLRDRSSARRVLRDARGVIREMRGRAGVLGFIVANEIPAELVRWMGHHRVRRFLERLIAVCRRADPAALYAYATYPTTEYLSPRNADFFACNIYLEDRSDYERYLRRLEHIAGNKPLVISEFGLDARRHGESAQAETLDWVWEAGLRAGIAGEVVFAWTDEWFTGGRDVSEAWGFGLVTRARARTTSLRHASGLAPHLQRPGQAVRLRHQPRFSIIVCTHNGSRTLRYRPRLAPAADLSGLRILVVDDGSTDSVPQAAAEFRDVRYLRIDHRGLSAARNHGAREATGEILAFLDDDAAADEDWLTYLALAFEGDRVGAAGGPNIHHQPLAWSKRASRLRPVGRLTFWSTTSTPSTFPAATWPSGVSSGRKSEGSTSAIALRATMSTSAGAARPWVPNCLSFRRHGLACPAPNLAHISGSKSGTAKRRRC